MRLKLGPEDRVQFEILYWLKSRQKKVWEHTIKIDNDGKRSIQGHQKVKILGLKKGASDLFIAWPTKTKHGLWLEVKREDYKINPKDPHIIRQLNFIELMTSVGYAGAMVVGKDEGIKTIKEYLCT